MDNQLIKSSLKLQKLIITVTILAFVISVIILGIYWQQNSDPYIKEVLSLEANVARGHDIFQINCAGCHASQIDESVGPNLKNVSKRKSDIEIIKQVTSGRTPPMPKFLPTSQEMADLLHYLKQLD